MSLYGESQRTPDSGFARSPRRLHPEDTRDPQAIGGSRSHSGWAWPPRRRIQWNRLQFIEGERIICRSPGNYLGLRLPGQPVRTYKAVAKLTAIATADSLWIQASGGIWHYPIASMVQAAYRSSPKGLICVDFLNGDPLFVMLRDDGKILDVLRRAIWEHEKSLLGESSDREWNLDLSPALLAEAEEAINSAIQLRVKPDCTYRDRYEAARLMNEADDLRWSARIEALRRRRRLAVLREAQS